MGEVELREEALNQHLEINDRNLNIVMPVISCFNGGPGPSIDEGFEPPEADPKL